MKRQTVPMRQSAVEVTGWGPGAAFFLENTVQQDAPALRKRINLFHPVQAGALVFVRPTGLFAVASPTAYSVEHVSRPDGEGRREVTLNTIRPSGQATIGHEYSETSASMQHRNHRGKA